MGAGAGTMSVLGSPVRAYDFLLKFLLVGDSDVGKGEILASLQDGAAESPYGHPAGERGSGEELGWGPGAGAQLGAGSAGHKTGWSLPGSAHTRRVAPVAPLFRTWGSQAASGGLGDDAVARPPSFRYALRVSGSEQLARSQGPPDLGVTSRRKAGGQLSQRLGMGPYREDHVSATRLERMRGVWRRREWLQAWDLSSGSQVVALRVGRLEEEGEKMKEA